MPQKASDHLHRLIRSLSRAEKRYFKLHTARHMVGGQSNMQTLFDAIAGMEEYDERALLDRFEHEAFTNRFAITKRRLYESVLRSLDAFHADASIDARLHRSLNQVEILYRRALYDDASKLLAGVRRSARQHDKQAVLVAVRQWEQRLVEVGNYARLSTADLNDFLEQGAALLEEQAQLDHLWDLKSRVIMGLYRQGQVRDTRGVGELAGLLNDPLLQHPERLRTARSRFLFHHLQGAAHFAMGTLPACREHLEAAYALLEADRERFQDEPNLVLSTLSNLIWVHVRSGAYEQAFQALTRFRSAPGEWNMPDNQDLDLKLFATTMSLELTIHGQMGAFAKAVELAPAVERGLAHHGERIGPVRKAALYYQLAYAYFGEGRYDKSLTWSNRLLNDVRMDDSAEVVCFARVLNLLARIESGDLDLLPHVLRSTERFLATRGRVHRFEPLFLETARSLIKAKDQGARRNAYSGFLEGIRAMESDPMERAVFDHLDPIAWAESKLGGRPYAELVRERAARMADAA